jgi:hypothetical protein
MLNAEQAVAVLMGLWAATTDKIRHPAGRDEAVNVAAHYTSQLEVSRDVISQARLMTVEQLVLTALGLNPLE